jgi:hypothetical protein
VCPANWQPGDDTIKPDQDKKLEFFSKATYKKIESSKKSDAPAKEDKNDSSADEIEDPEWGKKYPEPFPTDKDN